MKYFKLFENIKNEDYFLKIRNDYFISPIIDFSLKQRDGYRVSNDKVCFGTVMTYDADIEYLLHEMGHFVLFKDYSRLLKNEYGLNYPKIEVSGQTYNQALNWTDVKNETRAVIFQYILAKKYGILLDLNEWLKSLKYLDGFTFVPVDGAEIKEYKWYEKNGDEVKNSEKEKKKNNNYKEIFDEEIKKEHYNINHFNIEWFKRVKFLEENLGPPKINVYGYWDLSNALDITPLLQFLKNNNLNFKNDSYSNKLEIQIETMDLTTQKFLILELNKIESVKADEFKDTDNDVIVITPIKYY